MTKKQSQGTDTGGGVRLLKRNIIQLISDYSISPPPQIPCAYKRNEQKLIKLYKSLKRKVQTQIGGTIQFVNFGCNHTNFSQVPVHVIFKNRNNTIINKIRPGFRPVNLSYPTITIGGEGWWYIYIQKTDDQYIFSDHITMNQMLIDHITLYDFNTNEAHKLYLRVFDLQLCTVQVLDVLICTDIIRKRHNLTYIIDIDQIRMTLVPIMSNLQNGGKQEDTKNASSEKYSKYEQILKSADNKELTYEVVPLQLQDINTHELDMNNIYIIDHLKEFTDENSEESQKLI